MSKYLKSIECSVQPLDISFHPKCDNIIAAGLVDGTVEIHDLLAPSGPSNDSEDEHDSILSSMALHTQLVTFKEQEKVITRPASCRALTFSTDGERIYSGGSIGDLCAIDANRACTFSSNSDPDLLWRIDLATEEKSNPIVAIHPFSSSPFLATGDDIGGVRVWDERLMGNTNDSTWNSKRPRGCVFSWKENEDYISDLQTSKDGNTLLATSADGRLSVFDLRMARQPVQGRKCFRLSDDQEDELLSLQIMKNGRKVVCGSQEGVLSLFSWNTWGDCSDRFPGHPSSIDALLKVDEDTLLTGSSDGLIRVVQIHPDKFIGVLGNHDDFPIEKLAWNSNKELVGSMSHDNHIRLWDARVLSDDYDEGEEEEQKEEPSKAQVSVASKRNVTNTSDSEDDWEDENDSEEDGDSDDSDDSDEEEEETMNDQRKKRLKTENERFFEDL